MHVYQSLSFCHVILKNFRINRLFVHFLCVAQQTANFLSLETPVLTSLISLVPEVHRVSVEKHSLSNWNTCLQRKAHFQESQV